MSTISKSKQRENSTAPNCTTSGGGFVGASESVQVEKEENDCEDEWIDDKVDESCELRNEF
jgi:hypothetical protein